jgi:pyruvate formate lyase activating enzyme
MKSPSGVVFNIQRCSLHDGPGIRTTVFLKGCPLSCFWCQNPESQSGDPEILLDRRKCTLCGACLQACRNRAVRLAGGELVLDRAVCRGCGRCVTACPNEARSISGKRMSVEEVLREVLRDVTFYRRSGGGVTLSGGEPLAQPRFSREVLRRCKEEGLHTALDTCGCAPWPRLKEVLEYADLVLFDVKHLDAAKHREATGRDNRSILENAKRIAKFKPLRVRVPLIPGFNDSAETVGDIVRFAEDELGGPPVDLLPYNRLGEIKFDFLDKPGPALASQTDDHLRMLEALLR